MHAGGGGRGQWHGAGVAVRAAGPHHRRPLQRRRPKPAAVQRQPSKLRRVCMHALRLINKLIPMFSCSFACFSYKSNYMASFDRICTKIHYQDI